eukprot:CAMPEP_0178380226 /NCGR_PEP_ID=MMETSP0689_2-20121128/5351_1 /TAXON_ID=160604 /ORGANISM="Amphidinium massartii, Strain CS-259" /LENGTH=103 /DNA_ID=CAMNT_0020000357 /DNA_START=1110 /DNA_END=1421 /DNA_ORIENTATION=+
MTWTKADRPLGMGTRSHPVGDIRQQHVELRAQLMRGDDRNRMPSLRSSHLHFVQVDRRPRRRGPCHHHGATNLRACNELNWAWSILGACRSEAWSSPPVAMQD